MIVMNFAQAMNKEKESDKSIEKKEIAQHEYNDESFCCECSDCLSEPCEKSCESCEQSCSEFMCLSCLLCSFCCNGKSVYNK